MDLKQELRKLIDLQKIDTQIYSLKQKKEVENPGRLAEAEKKFEEKKLLLSSFQERLKQNQLKKKEKDLDLQTREDNVAKAKTQLYGLKTNKEYHAKLKEIEFLKADVGVLEDELLKVMEDIDTAEKELADQKAAFAEEEKKFLEQKRSIEEENRALETEIKQVEDKKRIVKDTIDKDILPVYERLIKTRDGLGVAAVEDEACGACHLRITPQTVNEIKMYKNLVFCESCIRILYLKEDIE